MSIKLPSYVERLGIYTLERRGQPYQWGVNDCVTFAADGIWAMTGIDPIEDIRGTWNDEASAMATLLALGGMVKAVDARFHQRIPATFAQRGDLCAMKLYGALTLGLCVGASVAAPGQDEMLMTPIDEIRVAWRV